MRYLLAVILAQTIFAAASFAQAVTWRGASVSVLVYQDGNTLSKTALTNRSYIQAAATRFGLDVKDLVIGFNESTTQLAVIKPATQQVIYNIVNGINGGGIANNGTNTTGFAARAATLSSLNADFSGFFFDGYSKKTDATLRSVTRLFIGGVTLQNGDGLTIKGTAKINAKKYIF